MNKNPLVSVFIPYYNDKAFIADAIEACLKQTYKNFELFLFNHASTDGSREIARLYADTRIHHVDAAENLGAGSGYNLKITLPKMRGKYVKLLCADDVMKPDCLEKLVGYLETHPDKDFVFSDMDYVDENKKDLKTKWSVEKSDVDFDNDEKRSLKNFFQGKSHLAYPTSLVKRDFLDDVHIDETFVMLFDVSLWVDALCKGKKIGFISDSTIWYRISPEQLSSANPIRAKRAAKQGYFELFALCQRFFDLKDILYVQYLCNGSKKSMLLKKGDEDLIPFVLAEHYLNAERNPENFVDQWNVYCVVGFLKMKELLDNPSMAKRIKEKFGYGIAEFRADYSWIDEPPKKTVAVKNSRNLSLFSLLFLIIRRIWLDFRNIVTLRPLRKRKAKKKQYTV